MSTDRPDRNEDTAVLTRKKTATPKRFKVILYNDDYTTMEFVIEVLETIFRKSPAEAVQIMMKVHKNGSGVAGVYTREIAETKVSTVQRVSQEAGFPLRAGLEEA